MDDSALEWEAPPAELTQALLRYLPEPVALLDHDGVVIFAGGQGAGLVDDGDSFAGRPLFEIVHPDHVIEAVDAFADTRSTASHRARVRLPIRAADGSYQDFELTMQNLAHVVAPDEPPAPGAVAIYLRNVTNRAMAEEALRAAQHRALHDPLTGLPNRVLFLDRLGQACARLRRSSGRLLVMFVDLDRLKAVNDTWATRPVTSCSSRSAVVSTRPCGPTTPSRASVATSSSSCAPTSPTVRCTSSSRTGCSRPSPGRSRSATSRSRSPRASASSRPATRQ
ncbi:MAG TPA: diguanylate cyclase, partial [Acidimicrobiia bacterium]